MMRSADHPDGVFSLCMEFVSALPIQHAAISTLGNPFEVETLCASDSLAARLNELQLDYGEGPCWQARATRTPVLIPDVRSPLAPAWPVVQAAIASHRIRAAYAFPLSIGSLDIGAVDLYAAAPDALSRNDVATATVMAEAAALPVLRHVMTHQNDTHGDDLSSRRIVHQATGMVIAQLRIPAEDALLVIRSHAFAADRSVADVASDVVARRLDFSD